jgi:gliding motility-associated-like protein
MNLKNLQDYNPVSVARKLITAVIFILLPALLYPQGIQKLDIYYYGIGGETGSQDTLRILNYIKDSLFFGGGKLSNPAFKGMPDGIGLFRSGQDLGFTNGMILSNGFVMTSVMDNGTNKNGAQAIPARDSLKSYNGGPPPDPPGMRDSDMDYIVGLIVGDMKPDTAVDPTVITFRFKPYYNSIHMTYVFASEEYQYEAQPSPSPPPPPVDVDFSTASASDFMGILVKRFPSEQGFDNIASVIGMEDDIPWRPVSVKYLNQGSKPPYYESNNDGKSYIFDGASMPMPIFPFPFSGGNITPCTNYWIKIGVADYPNGVVMQGYNLSYQINSAVFLKAFSLMSGYGLEWTVEGAVDNPDFASDTSLVEGGCSNFNIIIKFNVMPKDTMFLRMRIDNATLSDFTVTPPLIQDSLIMIPDSVMEWPMTITAIDDGINEGTNGMEPWFIRYTLDPCDVPTADTSGIGQAIAGYSGLIKVKVRDYNPYLNTHKTYGPVPSNIYHCGNDVTVSITDILQGGIPPYNYIWSHPVVPQLGIGEQFTTPISDSPDYVYCTITDRCSGKPGYLAGKDTVIIYSELVVQASSDFQLCQNGEADIQVQNTNVGGDFTTVWYFQGNPVGYDSIYTVTWAEYGQYAPSTIVFTCVVTDYCGNTDSDEVQATFFPVVEITGVPLICLGETIQLVCSGAQSYQWHYGSLGGPAIGNAQVLNYTPASAGFHTICVSIINDCGEQADTCFTFEVSQLICAVKLNNASDFNICPNVPFSLKELNAYDGWEWKWFDDGLNQMALGQTISLSLTDAGVHQVRVIAYNIHGCYDTLNFTVNVYPYSQVQAFTDLSSVCIDYPAQLSATSGPVSIVNYYWTANPPDASLAGQQNSASPVVTPQITTTYQCKIKDDNGCFDSTTVVVNVRPRLAGDIVAYPGFSCTDKPVQLNFQPIISPLPGASYYWVLADGVPPTSSSTQPNVIWSAPGQKSIQLTITEPGCEETFYFQYTVNPDPLAAFSASNNTGCQPVQVSFSNGSSNLENPSYLWDFGDGGTDMQTNPTHVYTDPGHYDVTLTVTNSTGCINTLTINDIVEVYEMPVADFTADPQAATIDNPTIRFTDESSLPWSIIDWDFGDGATTSGDGSPRHTYGAPGSYTVIMYTETEHGCWDRDTLEIGIMEDIKIFVPNAFSPNGDGLNDCFSVGGTTGDVIDVFHVIIYSRWGEQVYESQITNPDCVWDGKDMNGNLVTPDGYVFRIFGKNFRGARKVYEGIVTIVK